MEFTNFRCVFVGILALTVAQTATSTNTTGDGQTTPPTANPVTTKPPQPELTTQPAADDTSVAPTPDELCRQHNASCKDCLGVAGAKCLWCSSDSSCQLYPYSKVLPTSLCSLSEARWGVCWVNFEALIIGMSVTGGLIIIAFTVCICCCCCCRGKNKKKYDKDDARYDAQKMERKAKSDERRSERKDRLDEIRRKYGLVKDEPYQRFDA